MIAKNRLYDFKVLSVIFLVAIIVFVISDKITQKKTETIKQEKYKIYAQNIKNDIKQDILNKQESTYSIALAFSKSYSVIKALEDNNPSLLKLKEFSKSLSQTTRIKNAWFQVITKEGISFYRSWISKRGDPIVKSRLDIAKMIETPKVMNTISTGRLNQWFPFMITRMNFWEFLK